MTARMPSFLCFIAVGVLVFLVSGGVSARAADRLALVIGNAHYASVPVLSNPTNDAEDLAASLRSMGFDVIERSDASRAAMADAVREFSDKLDGADTALFFYAGHGVQVNGENYLLPVDAKISGLSDIRFGAINVTDVMNEMDGKAHASVIMLDACRDNPFAAALGKGGRSLGARGLSAINPNGSGMLVVYSTQPNNIALDGGGHNSPFTAALLAHMQKPGLEVRQLVSEVRADVLSSTDGKQVPWDNSSLVGNVYLMAPTSVLVSPTVPTVPTAAAGADVESLFWQSVVKDDSKAMYEGYLRQYGENGHFAFIAHQRIVSLSAPAPGIPLSVATPEPASAGPASRDTGCQQLVAHDPDLIDAKAAVPACEAELRQHPGNAALYGLGRAQTAAKNYIEANRLLDAAIKGGNTQAFSILGEAYYLGHGTPQSYARAYELFKQGADHGDTLAMVDLGAMYNNGYFVKKDSKKALSLFSQSVALGSYTALRNIGVLYYNGDGVPRNFRFALDYFNQAAEHGDALAMKVLADIYERGLAGVRRDPKKSREWNIKAGRIKL